MNWKELHVSITEDIIQQLREEKNDWTDNGWGKFKWTGVKKKKRIKK